MTSCRTRDCFTLVRHFTRFGNERFVNEETKGTSMQPSTIAIPRPVTERSMTLSASPLSEVPATNEAYSAGISWAAVIGGAFVSASLSLVLLALGTGLGFSMGSTWWNVGAGASTIGKAAIAWFIVTEILASALGGYLAGRLRTKWVQVHTDEVYFRDTAHGLLVWALGLVVTASLLGAAATSIAGGASQRNASAAMATGADTSLVNPNAYFVDSLFRSDGAGTQTADVAQRAEVERILSRAMRQGAMPATDQAYLAQLVSARTGLNSSDAENRVSQVFADAQQSAENARKTLAHLSLWLFVALLSGAFCASYAGTIGGKQRDFVRA
jgi:hypothetical protein